MLLTSYGVPPTDCKERTPYEVSRSDFTFRVDTIFHFYVASAAMAAQNLVAELQDHLNDLREDSSLPIDQKLLQTFTDQITGTRQNQPFP